MLLLLVIPAPLLVEATSFKMDFLSSGTVRTDPLMFSQTGECLSDHVHRSETVNKYLPVCFQYRILPSQVLRGSFGPNDATRGLLC